MKFIDTEKLIINHEALMQVKMNFAPITVNNDMTVKQLQGVIQTAVADWFADEEVYKKPTVFDLIVEGDISEDTFTSICNVTLAAFTAANCLKDGRKRERRLGVPETFNDNVHCSLSNLLKMINYETKVNRFNVWITCRGSNWNFRMVD